MCCHCHYVAGGDCNFRSLRSECFTVPREDFQLRVDGRDQKPDSLGLAEPEHFGDEFGALAGGNPKRTVGGLASGAPPWLEIGSESSEWESKFGGTFAKTVNESHAPSCGREENAKVRWGVQG
jgi:hypothetical protein